MTDKVVFICVVLNNGEGENFSWSKMFVNVKPQIIHDEIHNLVHKFPDMNERDLHMKRYGFDDMDDAYLDEHFNIITVAIHG